MATNNDLITLSDLATLGVDVASEADAAKASKWITYVSNYLRLIAQNNGVNLDEKMADDQANSGGVFTSVVQMVVANAVTRAIARNVDIPDATMFSQSASPYSETINFGSLNTQDAYFKHKELELLGFSTISGKSKIGVIRGVR